MRNKKGEKSEGEGWKRPPTPVIENIHQRIYEAVTAKPEAFDMGAWHHAGTCGTTHCRAGWITTLAGEAGKKLEDATSTLHAAMLIYRASDPTWRMSNFYDSNDGALADMKAMAERGYAGHAPAEEAQP